MLMGLDLYHDGVRNANGPMVPQCSGVYKIKANINLMHGPIRGKNLNYRVLHYEITLSIIRLYGCVPLYIPPHTRASYLIFMQKN